MTGIKTLRVTELVLEITCDWMVYIVLDSSNFRALVLAEAELHIAFPMNEYNMVYTNTVHFA